MNKVKVVYELLTELDIERIRNFLNLDDLGFLRNEFRKIIKVKKLEC